MLSHVLQQILFLTSLKYKTIFQFQYTIGQTREFNKQIYYCFQPGEIVLMDYNILKTTIKIIQ